MYLIEHFTFLDIKMKIIKLEAKIFFKDEFLEFKRKLIFFGIKDVNYMDMVFIMQLFNKYPDDYIIKIF